MEDHRRQPRCAAPREHIVTRETERATKQPGRKCPHCGNRTTLAQCFDCMSLSDVKRLIRTGNINNPDLFG